jgi:hypothetical protein
VDIGVRQKLEVFVAFSTTLEPSFCEPGNERKINENGRNIVVNRVLIGWIGNEAMRRDRARLTTMFRPFFFHFLVYKTTVQE